TVLRDAVARDPSSEQRRLVLAEFFVNRNDLSSAERVLLEATAQLPYASQLQFGVAALYVRMGQEAKARDQYTALIREY
ncbi:MAG TPA: hypothetical protein DDY39_19755, partial [Nitrospira sp.]|nr:hypothetical protein [Nitrospira sp.]